LNYNEGVEGVSSKPANPRRRVKESASLADFTATTPELKFLVHTGPPPCQAFDFRRYDRADACGVAQPDETQRAFELLD
jgi:hypothetical protein